MWPGTNLRNKMMMAGQPDSAAFGIGMRLHRADQVLCSACIGARDLTHHRPRPASERDAGGAGGGR
jgi:hypothetical protein